MCDYSLEHFASRPAKVGDTLVTTKFKHALTGGFCAVSDERSRLPSTRHRARVRAGDRKPSGVLPIPAAQTRSQRGAIPACE